MCKIIRVYMACLQNFPFHYNICHERRHISHYLSKIYRVQLSPEFSLALSECLNVSMKLKQLVSNSVCCIFSEDIFFSDYLTLKVLNTTIAECENTVDPDEMAHNNRWLIMSHLIWI